MKAYLLAKSGRPHVLKIYDLPEPLPQAGMVKVQLEYIGLNYAEILSRKGLYEWAPKRPYTPGMEGSGVITAVGEGVPAERVGQRVMIGTQYGCYAEQVVVAQEQALPVLPGLSMAEAAAFPVNYMTAWVSLFELARLQPGERVLITAAAGGVGTAAVQLAARSGARVIALAGSAEKLQLAGRLGADKAFNYRKADYLQQIREYTDGIDVVLEMVGGSVYRNNMELLNPLGRMVICGFASLNLKKWNPVTWWQTWRDIPRASIIKMAYKSCGVFSTHLGYLLKNPALMQKIFGRMRAFVDSKGIRPVIGRTFAFEELPDAHAFIESRRSSGKILIRV